MLKKRLIACLLMREGRIVQSVGFSRWLPIGAPRFSIERVVKWDVDEIVLLDMSATPQGRGPDTGVIEMLSEYCFVPLTVGGGIRTVDDVRRVIRAGADKACLNTAALANPTVLSEMADVFGCQCVVVSIDARRESDGSYRVYAGGRAPTSWTPADWARRCEQLGAGEIFLNSIDRDGSRRGYDLELIRSVADAVAIPVIACGGIGKHHQFAVGVTEGHAAAVAAANIFHHLEHSTILAKAHLVSAGVDVRLDSLATYQGREFDEDGRLMMLSAERLADIEFRRHQGERS